MATPSQLSVPYFATPSRICLFRWAHPHLAAAFLAFALAPLTAALFSVVAALIGILLAALVDVFEAVLEAALVNVLVGCLVGGFKAALDVVVETGLTLGFEAGSGLGFETVLSLAFEADLISKVVSGGAGAELVDGLGLGRGLVFAVLGAGFAGGFAFFLGRGAGGADLRGGASGFSV